MTVGILQPGYLPWLGFFEQLYKSDVFVLYDDVQYDRDGWRNRNRIKTPNGIQWLTVPVIFNYNYSPNINQVRIDNSKNWRKKHLSSIKQNYSKAKFFKNYIDLFEDIFNRNWELIVDIDVFLIRSFAELLGLGGKKIYLSSELNVVGDRISRLINICKMFNGDIFYEGAAGKQYIDDEIFLKNGIKVEYQNYQHPIYPQLYGDFVSHLSIIDLLFNCGNESLDILANIKKYNFDQKT